MHDAKIESQPTCVDLGHGTPRREFMFADDLADACLFVMQQYDETRSPINLGGGSDLSIREMAENDSRRRRLRGRTAIRRQQTRRHAAQSARLGSAHSPGLAAGDAVHRRPQQTYKWFLQRDPRQHGNRLMHEQFYKSLYRIRRVEEEMARNYPSDKIKSPVHLSIGQEAVAVGRVRSARARKTWSSAPTAAMPCTWPRGAT